MFTLWLKGLLQDFPGGLAAKSPTLKARAVGLIPGQGSVLHAAGTANN